MARRKQQEMGQRQVLEEAARRFALRKDIDPASALLDLVHYQAGVVQFWREQVELVPDDQLTWGVLKKVDKTGGKPKPKDDPWASTPATEDAPF